MKLDTLFIISCSAKKTDRLRQGPTPAGEAYAGASFLVAKHLLQSAKAQWCILSGGYGILWPDTVIEWYEEKMDPDPERPWDGEFDHIKQKQYGRLMTAERLVVIGSRLYARSAEVMLGRTIEAPVAGLPIGKMIAAIKAGHWLNSENLSYAA